MGSAVVAAAIAADGPRGSAASALERREILKALRQLRRGDFSVRMSLDLSGLDGEIAAGASEYISKPVDTDQLVSMMRVWLGRA